MNSGFAEPLKQVDRVFVYAHRRKLVYFGGCDYFRFASHPRVLSAVQKGLKQFGLSTSASRMTTGNHPLYGMVEARVARFFGAAHAVLTSSGYLANFAVAQALRGQLDLLLVDEYSHGSLRDSLALIGCRITRFKHLDAADLRRKLPRNGRAAIATDGLFSFDGSIAPLADYRRSAGNNVLLWVDDAHAGGVLGATGKGSIEHAGLTRGNTIQTVTFSKAFGVYGGAVVCDAPFRSALLERSSVVSGNTPLPLPLCAAVTTALALINRTKRNVLQANILRFWRVLGGDPPHALSPIIAMAAPNSKALSRALLSAGIYPSFIRYPGGPAEGYFRFALSSEHTAQQITTLGKTLRDAGATHLA